MLQAYTNNSTGTTVDANTAINFTNVVVETGCTATMTPGSTTVNLNKPGYYMVQFNAYGASSTAEASAVEITMYNNGTEVPYASSSDTSTSTTDIADIGFSTIVRVLPSCPSIDNDIALTFVNTGTAATVFYNTNVVVTKLC